MLNIDFFNKHQHNRNTKIKNLDDQQFLWILIDTKTEDQLWYRLFRVCDSMLGPAVYKCNIHSECTSVRHEVDTDTLV